MAERLGSGVSDAPLPAKEQEMTAPSNEEPAEDAAEARKSTPRKAPKAVPRKVAPTERQLLLRYLLNIVLTLHDMEVLAKSKTSTMVHKVWSDFEVTMEKGGEVYGSRTMHVAHSALLSRGEAFDPDLFPKKANGFGYVICTPLAADSIHAIAKKLLSVAKV